MPRSSRISSVIMGLALVASTFGAASAQAGEATFEPAECPFGMPAGQVEGETVDCGYVVVPENRTNPDSRSIRLAVAIFHPPGGIEHPDPLVYLEGGPGGSALKLLGLRDFEASYGPFLEQGREIIILDQRGVGRSEPALECPAFVERYVDLLDQRLDGPRLDGDQMRALKVEALTDCAEELGAGADLTAYNTTQNAADIEDLRRALGYEQLNLWGASYGTRLALDVMRDHPAGLRSVILDAPFPPEVDLYYVPDAFGRALGEVFSACAADEACEAAYPDLEGVFLEAVAGLDENPVAVTLLDQISGDRIPFLMDGDAFLEQVFRGLYSTAVRQELPGIIYDARDGTFDALLLITQLDILRQYFRSWGMYFSVLCHDEVPFSSLESFEASRDRQPQLAGMYDHFELGPLAYEVCANWDAGVADALESEPVRSSVPALIMTGQYDPIVPPAFGEGVASTLEEASFYVFPGVSHGASGTECATQLMLDFLDDPSATLDAACLSDSAVTGFALPVAAEAIELEPFESAELGLAGLRPTGWTEVAPGTFGRMRSGTDSTSLAVVALPLDTDAAMARLTQSFGLAEALVVLDRVEANGLAWATHRTEVQGAVIDIAMAEDDERTLLVLLTSSAAERDALYEEVFKPALEALALAPDGG